MPLGIFTCIWTSNKLKFHLKITRGCWENLQTNLGDTFFCRTLYNEHVNEYALWWMCSVLMSMLPRSVNVNSMMPCLVCWAVLACLSAWINMSSIQLLHSVALHSTNLFFITITITITIIIIIIITIGCKGTQFPSSNF